MKKENILEKNDLKPILNFINNEFIISASDPGLFVVEAITKYNGVKRTTYTEPLYLSNT